MNERALDKKLPRVGKKKKDKTICISLMFTAVLAAREDQKLQTLFHILLPSHIHSDVTGTQRNAGTNTNVFLYLILIHC